MNRWVRFLVALLAVARSGWSGPTKPLAPLRAETAPLLDGRLDDELWRQAPFVRGFKTWHPDFGKDMPDDTIVYLAYDRENLYFAFRSLDSEPDKIKASVTARDNIHRDDWVCINLDSFNDQQSLYAFYVNPLGIQGDTRYAAGTEDPGFDVVWYSAGTIDERGYTVEVRIPFKSIRFAGTEPVEMGVIFERSVSRLSTMGTYPPLDPKRGADFQNQMHPIVYEDVEHYKLFELLPAVTHARRHRLEGDELVSAGRQTDLSLTVKYGMTSDLILDGTLNPDFSQVEADAGQIDINLRAPLFFPEKRPFFLEGSEYWNAAGPTEHDPLRAVVHTRNIINPLGGVKVSGKLGARNMLAALYARDEPSAWGETGEEADFAVLRFKRGLRGDSYVGGFYTGKEGRDGYNRVFGMDGLLRTGQASTIGYHGFLAESVEDPSAGREDGHAVGVDYRFSNRNWEAGLTALDISERFRTDVGYMNRTGVSRLRAHAGAKLYPAGGLIQRVDPSVLTEHTYDKPAGIWETFNFVQTRLVLLRSSSLTVRYNISSEVYLGQELDTTGFSASGASQLTKELFLHVSYRQGAAVFYSDNPYQGDSRELAATLRYQPSDRWMRGSTTRGRASRAGPIRSAFTTTPSPVAD